MTLPEEEVFIKQRERLMEEMENVMRGKSKRFRTVTELARDSGFSRRTLYRMRNRWLESGRRREGLLHRRRGPKGLPYGKPPKYYERMIVKMRRRLGWSAPLIAAYLKTHNILNPSTGRPLSQRSCYDVLKRHPWPRKPDKKEVVRYEKKNPGELGHMDMKKLPNIKGENPKGKVATYGQIAAMAGNRRGARQVVWVLNSSSQKEALPWHRVINSRATISLTGEGYRLQRNLLEQEGIVFDEKDKINFEKFLWKPSAQPHQDDG